MEKKPTILQVLPELTSGGVERGTIEISQAIVREGWRSIVVSNGGPMESGVAYSGGVHIKLPVNSKHPLVIRSNIAHLCDVIEDNQVSLVHARSRAPALSAYYAAKKMKVPFVTTFHGVYGLKGFGKKRYNSIMTRGEKIIAVSRYIQKHIVEHYDAPLAKIKVIHRGADLNLFNPEKVTPGILAKLTQEWRLPDEHLPIIMMPGRLSRWKGHDVLIQALAQLQDKNFLCLMVGDTSGHPDYLEELKKLVIKHELEGKVRFVGRTPHMTEAYTLADMVVVPSTEPEAFGRVPVEAQAMGKIVIATDHGGAQETIIPNQTGFLVPPNDATELARAIARVQDMSEQMRIIIGQAAIDHVWENFSTEKMQQKTIELYQSLL